MARFAPYGSWSSPISAARVVAAASRVEQVALSDDAIWWSELRPAEGGRSQVVRLGADGGPHDVLPEGLSARSLVHEYGGGSWWLAGETLVFANAADQRLWRLDPGFDPTPVTPMPARPRGLRYADGLTTPDLRWFVCVQEAHPGEGGVPPDASEPANRLVAVAAHGGAAPVVLRDGADFVMSPALDRHGRMLAWIEWSHPDMPWDSAELWVAELDRTGDLPRLVDPERVAGGPGESVMSPVWDLDDRLWFVSDRSDWWNLYHFPRPDRPAGEPIPVAPGPWEVGLPPWVFAESRYAVLGDGRVVLAYSTDGVDHLSVYEPMTGRLDHLPVPYTSIHQVRARDSSVVFVGASFTAEAAVVTSLVGRGAASPPKPAVPRADLGLSSSTISEGQPITFPTVGGKVAHGIYYPPTNAAFVAPDGTRPPLVVTIHGGPTAAAAPQLNLRTQFWTSRGFAVVDVNYRGSTGFGRRFREELRGRWGIADVEDCVAAAEFLARSGRADAERLVIRGSSAGGLTVLNALAFHDTFAAGCSLYGVADLTALAADTHKFEARYLDTLVAPLPEGAEVYRDRSPVHHLDRLRRPVILFQGLDDPVVPPAQSQAVADALDRAGVPHAYVTFAGESHGFRRAESMQRCLDAELSFYAQVLGLPHPEDVERVVVRHLDAG